jgi:hypothetical protein
MKHTHNTVDRRRITVIVNSKEVLLHRAVLIREKEHFGFALLRKKALRNFPYLTVLWYISEEGP